MKKIGLLLSLLLILLIAGKNDAQTLVCNDLVFVSLDEDCTHSMSPEEVLEGVILPDCVVELDKIPPFGNGPWVTAVLGPSDVGETYVVRVKHLPSGTICWGNVTVEDKINPTLLCGGVTTIDLGGSGGPVSITPADLNVTTTDACGAVTLDFASGPGTVEYDCADLGVSVVSLIATDESGNTSTCQHTVLVANADNCENCLAECPPSVVVSFEEGNDVLYPAYVAGDLTPFDAYGNPLFDYQNCTLLDSFFAGSYQAGTAGYDWFVRQWIFIDGGGQFLLCEQQIVYPTTHTVAVQGKVYLDGSDDCVSDAGEQGVDQFPLVITKFPAGTTQVVFPDADGTYALAIVFSPLDSAAEVRLALPVGVNSVCPSAFVIPNTTSTPSYDFDFGLQSQGDCPLMQADLGAFTSRRCQTNSFAVQYCNVGLDTAYNAYVTIALDTLMSLQSSTLPYTTGPDGSFTFEVGDVAPFRCGTFYFGALISCEAEIGQTLCTEAWAYPNTPCDGPWEGALVATTAHCNGDTVSLAVWNIGQEDMTAPLNFIVIEDFIMYKDDAFQLAAGDSITIQTLANGSTWRIEAEQMPGFPIVELSSAAVEGCGGLNTLGLINAYAQSDNAGYYDLECVAVTASFDPNDKTAVPSGLGAEHLIRANEALEYKIRFQNTGNDTAFRVVLMDTLPALLDPLTLETGAASHPYRLNIFPGGILQFVFDPIILPDSNANEAASRGFVQFRIAQQPDLPDGTVIENSAAIYFDENDPVITNTAFHTIGYPFIVLESQTPYAPGVAVMVRPNPFGQQTLLTVQGRDLQDGRLLLYDAQGRLVRTQFLNANQALIERAELPAGLYFFQVLENGASIVGGKIQAY